LSPAETLARFFLYSETVDRESVRGKFTAQPGVQLGNARAARRLPRFSPGNLDLSRNRNLS
jgi:hypothetical protein